jgi:hypothetical protein
MAGHDARHLRSTWVPGPLTAVARYRDLMLGDTNSVEPGWGKAFWIAFVGNEYVLVDGAPGHWHREADAKAAADADYRARRESGAIVPAAAPRPAHQRNGPIAFIRDLIAGWRAARRSRG